MAYPPQRHSPEVQYYENRGHSPEPQMSYPPSPSMSTTDLHAPYRLPQGEASSSTLVSAPYGSYGNMSVYGDSDTASIAPLNKKRYSANLSPRSPMPNSAHPLRTAFTPSRVSLSTRQSSYERDRERDRVPSAIQMNAQGRARSRSMSQSKSQPPLNTNTVPTPEPYTSLAIFRPSRERQNLYTPREHHLDFLKFLAALFVLTGTFFQAFLPTVAAPLAIAPGGSMEPLISQHLGITCFLMLTGRALTAPLYNPYPNSSSYRPSFHLLSRQILLRPIRYGAPVVVVAVIQWALGDTALQTANSLNNANFVPPEWKSISNFGGLMNLIWGCFTWGADSASVVQTFGSNLWMSAWLFQASYFALILFVVLAPLPSSKYWLMILIAPFLWATNSYFLPTLIGVFLTDLGAHGWTPLLNLHLGFRIPLQLGALVLAAVVELVPAIRTPINNGMAAWNVRGQNYINIQFTDILFAALVIIAIDSSPLLKSILGFRPLRALSRLSSGAALMAPLVVYAVLPNMNPSLFVGWLLTVLLSLVLAIPFRIFLEVPAMAAAEITLEKMRTWGGDGLELRDVDAYWGRHNGEDKESESSEMTELKREKR
ncbi:hypothetical protein DACRYDRAFT_21096 [Dacryopinax primogenitus]|uniref:Uncharacterized protein n=1 Tax=Dacryopinax primogenitus (strain DJM 731) TaxID=1858805 RepID=M5G5P8_DACPD|nr:uncharacterized protein DACRYDRAFT_21096 [Dacryopinax primogenitus]EJU03540.1 hypothetical protein DACRYDRAFT_21096 [Dacryopinax primogenitus]